MQTLCLINWGNALIVTCLGIGIVFLVLCLLVFLLKGFGIAINSTNKEETLEDSNPEEDKESELEIAAIATAIDLYQGECHDQKSYCLTIKEKESPWNAKIYNSNNLIR